MHDTTLEVDRERCIRCYSFILPHSVGALCSRPNTDALSVPVPVTKGRFSLKVADSCCVAQKMEYYSRVPAEV